MEDSPRGNKLKYVKTEIEFCVPSGVAAMRVDTDAVVSSVEDVEIVALADPSEASLEAFKETVGLDESLPTYANHVEMLDTVKHGCRGY